MSHSVSQFEREVGEQGEILAARTDVGRETAAQAAGVLSRQDVDYLTIAARGSSDNAARYAQYLFGADARLVVGLATPWLYSSQKPPLLSRGAMLAISQSGRSPDIVAAIEAARAQGRPTIAITNDPASPLAERAEVVVPLLAGDECSVAATKTYLASLHAIAQIAAFLRPEAEREIWFERLPRLVSEMVEAQLAERSRFDRLHGASLVTVVGRGLELATAYETALKVRELGAVPAEAFSFPDLIHGPIAGLRRTGALWLISTAGHDQPNLDALQLLRQASRVSIVVSDNDELLGAADIALKLEAGLPEWVAPMLAVIPGQSAALRLGELRGGDLDHPAGLTKVTLTT